MPGDAPKTGASGYREKDPPNEGRGLTWEFESHYDEKNPKIFYSPKLAAHASVAVFWRELAPSKKPEHYKSVDAELEKQPAQDTSGTGGRAHKDQFKKVSDEKKKSVATPGKKVGTAPVLPCGRQPPKTTPACNHRVTTLSCSHKRSLAISQGSNLVQKNASKVMEVVGHGCDNITLKAELLAGPCGKHNHHVLFSDKNPVVLTSTDTLLTFKAEAQGVRPNPLLPSSIWPVNPPLTHYTVNGVTCQHSDSAAVIVYPDTAWDAKVRMAALPNKSRSVTAGHRSEKTSGRDPIWHEEDPEYFSLTAMHNGTLNVFDSPASLKKIRTLLGIAEKASQAVVKIAGTLSIKVTFLWPNIGFRGEWGWEEREKDHLCEFKATIYFGAYPLFGVGIDWDILDALCKLYGPFGKFIAQIRDAIGDWVKIEIKFTMEGTIAGETETTFSKLSSESSLRTTDSAGALRLDIPATIYGLIEAHVFYLAAGAAIGLHSGFEGVLKVGADSKGPYIKPDLKLNAGGLYYALFVGSDVKLDFKGPPKVVLWDEIEVAGGEPIYVCGS